MRIRDVMPDTNLVQVYAEQLNTCHSLQDLAFHSNEWIELAPQAPLQSKYWGAHEWKEFRTILNVITMGMAYPGDRSWCDEILLPSVLNFTLNFAQQTRLPQGTALHLAFQRGYIINEGTRTAPKLYVSQSGGQYAQHYFRLSVKESL